MADVSDQDLICDYARSSSEDAFGELVHRHVDFVYSTAFRVLRDPNLAEDVTQRVFTALARNATKLRTRVVLAGWLHETARNFAVTTVRSEERRRLREQEAATLDSHDSNEAQTAWQQIEPHLDRALDQLGEADRDAILLRYFERKTAREIGQRLGLTEEAAQKRATRALERLRVILMERGAAAPVAAFGSMLSVQTVQSAPVGLTASVIAASGTVGAFIPATSIIGPIMASTKVKIGLAAALVAGVSTPLMLQYQSNARLRNEIAALRQQSAELEGLREENQRLAARGADPEETAKQHQEHAELLRLRGEVGLLRARAAELSRAREDRATAAPSKPAAMEMPLLPAETWTNVGYATPSAAFQTLTWAKANRATNVIANSLAWADERSRAQIEALFASAPEHVRARYGSADAFILSLFDHPTPDDSRRLTSFRILSEETAGDEATLAYEANYANGRTIQNTMRYVRIDGEWRQTLDFDQPATGKLSRVLEVPESRGPESR